MKQYRSLKIYLFIFSIFFLTFSNLVTSIVVFAIMNTVLALLTFVTANSRMRRAIIVLSYVCITAVQISYAVFVLDAEITSTLDGIVVMIILYLLLAFSYALEHYLQIKNYQKYFFHNEENVPTLPFADLQEFTDMLRDKRRRLSKTTSVITRKNIRFMIEEILRNNSFVYINNGTLSDDYIRTLRGTVDDEAVYIVLSDTRSVSSQMLSVFTDKAYNHVSISFDRDLKTLVSYNGGARINPPGLNSEMIDFFSNKDAGIYVYKLNVTKEQKQMMIDKVEEINTNGSAYNLLGLMLKKSYKPNIMYCSQFVYTLLKHAGATYFEKDQNDIRPTDLVELDYRRKLTFEYEIRFK